MESERVRSLYRRKEWMRMMISYAALSVFLVLLCGGWLYTKANRIVLDEVSREGQGRLTSFERFVEDTFLQRYKDLFSDKVIATINSHSNDEMAYFLDRGYEQSQSRAYRLVNDLAVTVQSNEGLHNVSIVFSHSGFAVDDSFFYASPGHSPDHAFLEKLAMQPVETWIPREYPDGEPVFTYIYTLPYKAAGDRVRGYLLINVSRKAMERQIDFLAASPSERLLVLNDAGRPIVNSRFMNRLDPEAVRMALEERESGYAISGSRGEATVTSFTRAVRSSEGWIYMIVRPMRESYLATRNLHNDIITICLVVLIIGLPAAFWLSRRSYKPLANLVRSITSRYGSSLPAHADSGEYGLIDATFQEMDNSIARLQGSVRYASVELLLSGNLTKIDDFGFVEPYRSFAVAQFELASGAMDRFRSALLERVEDVWSCDALDDGDRMLKLLVKSGADRPLRERELQALFADIAGRLEPACRFACGIGAPQASIEDIRLSAEQAARALRYRFIAGRCAVIPISSVSGCTEPVKGILYDNLQPAIRSGEKARVEQFMRQAEASLRQENLQLEAIELALLRLYSALSETLLDSGFHPEWFADGDPLRSSMQETLEETLDRLRGSALEATEFFGRDSGSAHAELIHKLKAYIDEHAHEDLSLDLLAQIAGLSPAYVSTLFKEVLHVSYSEYLTDVRMERAKRLLAEQRLTVTEIAGRVGYRNLQYFSTKFKAYTGMTPNQYRLSLGGS